jgi:hypothetical protein
LAAHDEPLFPHNPQMQKAQGWDAKRS